MNKTCIGAALAACLLPIAASAAPADDGAFIVRGRALYLHSANNDDTGLGLSINHKTFPELDLTWFATPNLALELVLTYPQKHDVRLGGSTIGTVKHLPPTLSLQYHFTGLPGWRPYVGAGVNYTRFSNVNLPAGVGIDKNSVGLALGAGADVALGNGWLLNVDLKKVQIRTDVSVGGVNQGTFKIDPVLFSVGVGRRF
jgi:outer membrane protein